MKIFKFQKGKMINNMLIRIRHINSHNIRYEMKFMCGKHLFVTVVAKHL